MYMVKITPNFYANHLPTQQPSLVVDDNHDILMFEEEHEAQAWIDHQRDEEINPSTQCYHLQHGEYDRPSYEVVDGTDGCLPHRLDAQAYDDYTQIDATQLPDDVTEALHNQNVYADHYTEDYTRYSAHYMGDDGRQWIVAYAVDPCSEQLYSDDLSMIDWINPSYYVQSID